MRTSHQTRASLIAATALATVTGLTLAQPAEARSATTFYVSPTGSDSAPGTQAQPWLSVARVSRAALQPGDQVLFKRGGTYPGTLRIGASGTSTARIGISAYGTGALPTFTRGCVELDGNWLDITFYRARSCSWAGVGVTGDHDRVLDGVSTDNVAGIYVRPGASYARITRNQVIDNRRMSVNTPGGDDDSGAFGVLVRGDYARVSWNTINGQHAMSYDYGMDGAAVEIYGAVGTSVDHNLTADNNTFSELGNPRTRDTSYRFNVVTTRQDDATFLITRGAATSWGPVKNTFVSHNTVVLTGAHSQGFICHAGCNTSVLTMRANLIKAVLKVGYADGPYAGGYNMYSGGQRQFKLQTGDFVGDPMFVDAAHGDLSLRKASPAVDRSHSQDTGMVDIEHRVLPRDGDGDGIRASDIGAFER